MRAQAKFGIPVVAANQLEIYTTAVLLASMKPPSNPREEAWVANMDELGDLSCNAYRCALHLQAVTPILLRCAAVRTDCCSLLCA